jgi:hypothetical protein
MKCSLSTWGSDPKCPFLLGRRTKMNPYFKRMLFAAAAIAALLTIQVFASSVSAAGPSLGFPKGKPYYGSSNQRMSRSGMRSWSTYRSTAPVIVRSERAPEAVAQGLTDTRSFSYEPSQAVQSGDLDCGEIVRTESAPATAERSVDRGRSYSYEPSMSDSSSGSSAAPRRYSSPRMRSYRSQTNWLSAPKDVRNNYRN